jgi:hypothetical protein
MEWSKFFGEGGWGMYPTSIFGFLLVACGVIYLLRPERRFIPVLAMAGIMTVGAGVLGTAVGFVTTFHYAAHHTPESERFALAAQGVAESLHNLVLSMMLLVATALIAWLGSLRAARRAAGEAAL